MKKSCIFFLIYFSLVIFFSGCSKKNKSDLVNEESLKNIHDYVYAYTLSALSSEFDKKYFIPVSLKTELDRYFINANCMKTGMEILFPDKIDLTEYSDVYDCHSDNGLWIDEMIVALEEERIGSELLEMEELIKSGAYGSNGENNLIAKEVYDYDNNLSFMEYDKEILVPQKKNGELVLIHESEGNVVRKHYDDLYRCYCEETWNIDNKGKEELLKTVETKFQGSEYIPLSKQTKDENNKILQKFNDKGLLTSEEKFAIVEDKEYKISDMKIEYVDGDKVSSSIVTEFTYSDNKYSDLLYKFVKKYLYKYNSDDIPPNFDYYEDDKLKIKKSYESKDSYSSQIFFEDGYSVTTFYENNKLKKEVFKTKDGEETVKDYE